MNKYFKALFVSLVVVFARFVRFNHIFGSIGSSFSLSTMFAPVVAAQCGFLWVLTFVFCKKVLIAPSFLIFFHRIPLLCAARVFQKKELLLSVYLPALCIALFMIHPVGSVAWPYALYWLIPMMLCFAQDVVWVRALQASFVAHAVGSVAWLYFGTIPAHVWMSLIPLVVCERLLMAGGMVICNQVCNIVVQMFKKNLFYKQILSFFVRPEEFVLIDQRKSV